MESRQTSWQHKNLEKGLCRQCTNLPKEGYKFCDKCLERNKRYSSSYYNKTKHLVAEERQKLRFIVLGAYGNQCNCCGESEDRFLHIDHINNDGHKQRKKIPGSLAFYKWIIKK